MWLQFLHAVVWWTIFTLLWHVLVKGIMRLSSYASLFLGTFTMLTLTLLLWHFGFLHYYYDIFSSISNFLVLTSTFCQLLFISNFHGFWVSRYIHLSWGTQKTTYDTHVMHTCVHTNKHMETHIHITCRHASMDEHAYMHLCVSHWLLVRVFSPSSFKNCLNNFDHTL